jgi:hypothetical protein
MPMLLDALRLATDSSVSASLKKSERSRSRQPSRRRISTTEGEAKLTTAASGAKSFVMSGAAKESSMFGKAGGERSGLPTVALELLVQAHLRAKRATAGQPSRRRAKVGEPHFRELEPAGRVAATGGGVAGRGVSGSPTLPIEHKSTGRWTFCCWLSATSHLKQQSVP